MQFISIPTLTMTDKQRFWNKIQVTDHCHLWTGSFNRANSARPTFSIGHYPYYAARVAWFLATGDDPGQLLVLHDCKPLSDNPICMNPSHLWLGSHSDNIRDAIAKGQRLTVGEYMRYFRPEQVREIRRLASSGWTLEAIGNQFGCSYRTICSIVNYTYYKNIH